MEKLVTGLLIVLSTLFLGESASAQYYREFLSIEEREMYQWREAARILGIEMPKGLTYTNQLEPKLGNAVFSYIGRFIGELKQADTNGFYWFRPERSMQRIQITSEFTKDESAVVRASRMELVSNYRPTCQILAPRAIQVK